MKKAFLFLAIYLLLIPFSARAHESAQDGTIHVLFHTEPDDNAVAGKPTTIHFQVSEEKGGFQPTNCDCILSISQNNQPLFKGQIPPLTASTSIYSFGMSYIFPKKGSYQVTLSGKPKAPSTFQSFRVSYTIKILPSSIEQIQQNKKMLTAIGIGIIVILLFAWWNFKKNKTHYN